MKIRYQLTTLVLLGAVLSGVGCSRLRAKAAFKEGNKAYKEQNFRQAIEEYRRAIELDPAMAEAHFYLASSHQALFRPSREGDENRVLLDTALEHYKKALELNQDASEPMKKVRANTLAALIGLYSDDPFKDFDAAHGYASQLVEADPGEAKNLYAMANLFERFGKFEQAEEIYNRIFAENADDTKACAALAAFFNKPYWEGRSKFDRTVETLEKCAALAPGDPAGYHRLAAFYWEKAFKDPDLNEGQRLSLADKGLTQVDRAIELNPEYIEALVYKNLLLRVKARFTRDARERNRYQDEVDQLMKEVKRLQEEKKAAASPPPDSPAS